MKIGLATTGSAAGSAALGAAALGAGLGFEPILEGPFEVFFLGGVVRSRALAKVLGLSDLAIIDKRRDEANQSEVMNVIGDVENKDCIIVDDIADTAGTLCNAASALKENGATKVYAYIVHPVLSGNAIEKISKSKLDQLVVTDTIPLSEEAQACKKIRIITMAPTLAEAIRRVNNEESISAMFL